MINDAAINDAYFPTTLFEVFLFHRAAALNQI